MRQQSPLRHSRRSVVSSHRAPSANLGDPLWTAILLVAVRILQRRDFSRHPLATSQLPASFSPQLIELDVADAGITGGTIVDVRFAASEKAAEVIENAKTEPSTAQINCIDSLDKSEETRFARSAVTALWAIAIAIAKLTASPPPWLLTAMP